MKARAAKRNKNQPLLTAMAQSIGSAMGTIAATANATQKALTRGPVTRTAKRESRKLVRKSSKSGRGANHSIPARMKKISLARATRRRFRRAPSATKRAVRGGSANARSARRVSARK